MAHDSNNPSNIYDCTCIGIDNPDGNGLPYPDGPIPGGGLVMTDTGFEIDPAVFNNIDFLNWISQAKPGDELVLSRSTIARLYPGLDGEGTITGNSDPNVGNYHICDCDDVATDTSLGNGIEALNAFCLKYGLSYYIDKYQNYVFTKLPSIP